MENDKYSMRSYAEREYEVVSLSETDLQWLSRQLQVGERLIKNKNDRAEAFGWRSGVAARLSTIDPLGGVGEGSCSGIWHSAQYINGYYPKDQFEEWLVIRKSVAILRSFVDRKSVSIRLKWREGAVVDSQKPSKLSADVFIVHGHNEGVRESVARFLAKIGLNPIILHEKANRGMTIIEKIEQNSDVGFAVILLTPDDEGRVKNGELAPRARQNVLLEMGYFFARLGRNRICVLKSGDLEMPSDFAGVVWTEMDDGGGWKEALARELEESGHEIDWNNVMR